MDLFITGRLKDLIILRGANHYPRISSTRCRPVTPHSGQMAAPHSRPTSMEPARKSSSWCRRSSARRCGGWMLRPIGEAAREAVLREHGLELALLVSSSPAACRGRRAEKLQRSECRSAFLQRTLPVVAESRPLSAPVGDVGIARGDGEIDGGREVLRQASAFSCYASCWSRSIAPPSR